MPVEIIALNAENALSIANNSHSAIILTKLQLTNLKGNTILINCNIVEEDRIIIGGVVERTFIKPNKILFDKKRGEIILRVHTTTKKFDHRKANDLIYGKANFWHYNEWCELVKPFDCLYILPLIDLNKKKRCQKYDTSFNADIISASL